MNVLKDFFVVSYIVTIVLTVVNIIIFLATRIEDDFRFAEWYKKFLLIYYSVFILWFVYCYLLFY